MIVCWLVFGLAVAVAVLGWSTRRAAFSDFQQVSVAIQEHPAARLNASDQGYKTIIDEDGRTVSDLLREQRWRVDDLDKRSEVADVLLTAAYVILLWNIIWHTGH